MSMMAPADREGGTVRWHFTVPWYSGQECGREGLTSLTKHTPIINSVLFLCFLDAKEMQKCERLLNRHTQKGAEFAFH